MPSSKSTDPSDRRMREIEPVPEPVESTHLLAADSQDDNGNNERDDETLVGSSTKPTDTPSPTQDFDHLPWWRKPSVYWIIFPYMIFTLAFGGIIVPRVNLILGLVCDRYYADRSLADPTLVYTPIVLGGENPQCRTPEVHSRTVSFMMALDLCTGLLSAVIAPKMGQLSDRYGRRRLLALASCGGLLNELVTILAVKFPDVIDYRWMILGSVFDGLTGSLTAGGILGQAYTSDCTVPARRTEAFGFLSACLFGGVALGPLLAAYIVAWTGSLLTIFYIALGCHAFFIFFVALVVPESLSKRRRQAAHEEWDKEKVARAERSGSRWAAVKNHNPLLSLKVLWPQGPGTSDKLRASLIALAVGDVTIVGVGMAAGKVIILYAEFVFDWGNTETSQFVSGMSVVRVLTLSLLLPAINYFGRVRPARKVRERWGESAVEESKGVDRIDLWTLRLALVADIVGFLGFTLSRQPVWFWVSGIIGGFGGLGGATAQAALTKLVPPERTGQVLGAVGALHAQARVVGPIAFNGLYALTTKTFPQGFFLLIMALFIVALFVSFFIHPNVRWEDPSQADTEPVGSEQRYADIVPHAEALEEEGVLIL